MAGRPHKQGLDYFSFDTDFMDDEKIEDLQELFPDTGPMFYIKMLCFIYKRGNYIEWNKTIRRQFLKLHPYKPDELSQYMDALFDLDLFDKKLFTNYTVITSSSLQERYLYSTKRRELV